MTSHSWKLRVANAEFLRSKKVKEYMAEKMNGSACINVRYDLNGRITDLLYKSDCNAFNEITDCATLGVKKLSDGKYFLTLYLEEDVDNNVKMTLEETVKEFNSLKRA